MTLDLLGNQEPKEILDSSEQMVIQDPQVHQDPSVPRVLKVSRESEVVPSVLGTKELKGCPVIKDLLDCQVCNYD